MLGSVVGMSSHREQVTEAVGIGKTKVEGPYLQSMFLLCNNRV